MSSTALNGLWGLDLAGRNEMSNIFDFVPSPASSRSFSTRKPATTDLKRRKSRKPYYIASLNINQISSNISLCTRRVIGKATKSSNGLRRRSLRVALGSRLVHISCAVFRNENELSSTEYRLGAHQAGVLDVSLKEEMFWTPICGRP